MGRLSEGLDLIDAALTARDEHTSFHCSRTEALAMELGMYCGLTDRESHVLRVAARAHDVGKIGVSDKVLLKDGPLDSLEWSAMKTHSQCGYDLIRAIQGPGVSMVADIVRYHHENFDGTGYPTGLAGEAIPVMARIVSITDSYDAIAERRSYHGARGHGDVMAILNGANAHKYDPYLLGKFNTFITSSPFRAAERPR